ncbi:MAG: DUF4422 domain-containing protein [Prevotella sp.]|nr:DUF4422 domain-containing protein [Prevotella sp.]
MKNIKIGVAYHKISPIISNEVFIPIQVGKSLNHNLDLHIQPDNEGDNISDKNDYYCELTALYWIWKNTTADYKGLCHYRRFFSTKKSIYYRLYKNLRFIQDIRHHLFFAMPYIEYDDINSFQEDAYKSLQGIDGLLDKYHIICSTDVLENRSNYWHFVLYGQDIMNLIERIIHKDYFAFYQEFKNSINCTRFCFANMTIMRNDLFDEYCNYLFGVLEKVEAMLIAEEWLIDLHKERFFSRKLGYFAEFLTNIFVRTKMRQGFFVRRLDVAILK